MAIFYAQQVVDAIFAGRGDTRTPMRLALTANALILVLDPLLIYGPGPLPALGVTGAALATALGRTVALVIGLLRQRTPARAAPRTTMRWARSCAPARRSPETSWYG
ncbi:hypothetical protein GCM10023107_00640 [Actinoplanes octamycinicus]|uniref:polysaccharide biosynthesis C-terminal domain-containing protein n=1 Tax=Actinoplanes octamycinicus TaxID=135948 RepID=UPI0031E8E205